MSYWLSWQTCPDSRLTCSPLSSVTIHMLQGLFCSVALSWAVETTTEKYTCKVCVCGFLCVVVYVGGCFVF